MAHESDTTTARTGGDRPLSSRASNRGSDLRRDTTRPQRPPGSRIPLTFAAQRKPTRIRSIAGGGAHLSPPAQEAIHAEGAATAASPSTPRSIGAWLFQSDDEPRAVALGEVGALAAEKGTFLWVDLAGYSPDDLRSVGSLLRLHRIAVHTALSAWQRPRLDIFGDAYFACVTLARLDTEELRVHAGQLDLFVGPNYLVSAHRLPLPFAERILDRARQNPDLVRHDASYMLYIVLDELLQHYETLDEEVQAQLEILEERALTDTSEILLEDLLRFKRYLFALDHLAEQHRSVFAAFLRPDFTFVSGQEVDVYFRDLDNRLAHVLDAFQAAQEAVNGAFDIYVSHVSYRTNQIMKLLTMVSTVLLPATLIVALFGTNFHQLPLYEPWDFTLMLGIIVLVGATVLYAFRRQGWI